MNNFLVALIGFIAMLAVGSAVYRFSYKVVAKEDEPHAPSKIVMSMVAMYLVALGFIVLFDDITFASGAIGAMKGLYLGILVAAVGFGLPVFADGHYLKANKDSLNAFTLNWVLSFIVLGLVVGLLRG